MWFSSTQVPLLVCWVSHLCLQRLKFTALEDAERLQSKSNKSLMKFSIVGGTGRSIWQRTDLPQQLCFPGTAELLQSKRRQGLCSQSPCAPIAARAPSDPAHAGTPLGYMLLTWPTARAKEQCMTVNLCVHDRERQREAQRCQWVQSLRGEKPYHPRVQCNAHIRESNLRFLISLPRLFQPACPVYSRTKW